MNKHADSLAELTLEAKDFMDVVSSKSDDIIEVENKLTDLRLLIPLQLKVGERNNSAYYLSWESNYDEITNKKKWQIFLVTKEISSGHSMFKMPLIEANIATRLKYIVYLDEFLRQFKEHLIVLTKQCNKEDEEDK